MSATGQEGAAESQAPRPSTPERLPRRQQFLEWKRQRELSQQQQQQGQQLGGGRRRHSSTPADLERQRLLLQRRVNMTPLTLKAAGVGPQESPSPGAKRRSSSSSSSSGLKTPSPTTAKTRQEKQRAFLPLASDDHEHRDDTTTGSEPTHSGTNSQSSEEVVSDEEEEDGEEEERRRLEFLLQEELGDEDDQGAAADDNDEDESHGDSDIEEDVAILDEPMPLMEFDAERATPVDLEAEGEAFVDKDEESFDVDQEEDPAFWPVGEEAERLLMNYSMQSETTEEENAPIDFSLSANSDAFDETDPHFSDERSHELHLTDFESSGLDLSASETQESQEYDSDHDEQDEHEELDYEFTEIDLNASAVDQKPEELSDIDQSEREALAAELEALTVDADSAEDLEVKIQTETKPTSAGRMMSGTLILAIVYTIVLASCAAVCQYYPDSSFGQWLLSTKEHAILFFEDAYVSIQKHAVWLWNTTQEQLGVAKSTLEDQLIGSYAVWHHAIHTYAPTIDLDQICESVSIVMTATVDRAHILLSPLLEDPVGTAHSAMTKAYDVVDSGVAFIGTSLSDFWLNSVASSATSSQDLVEASRKRLLESLELNSQSANDMVSNQERWALSEKKRKEARRTEISQAKQSIVAYTETAIMKEIQNTKESATDQIKARAQQVVDEIEKELQLDLNQFELARIAAESEDIVLLTDEAKKKIDHVAHLEQKQHQEMEDAAAEALVAQRDLEHQEELRLAAKAAAEAARLIPQDESNLVEVGIKMEVEVENEQLHAFVEIEEHLEGVTKPSRPDGSHFMVNNSVQPSIEESLQLPVSGMDLQSLLIVSVISLVFLAFGGISAYFLRHRIQRMMQHRHSHIRRKRWQRPVELSDSEEEVVVLLSDDNEPEPEKMSPTPDWRRFTSAEVPTPSDEPITIAEVPAPPAVSVDAGQEDVETRTSESSVSSADHVRFSETVETVSRQNDTSPSSSTVRRYSRRIQRRQSPTQ